MSATPEPEESDLAALRDERRSRERGPRRRTGLLALVLVAAAAALAASAFLRTPPPSPAKGRETAIRAAREDLARIEARNWSKVEILSPGQERRDPTTGEVTSPFQGFAISVDSSPAGARVLVGGSEMGMTPLAASVSCEPGHEVEVRVEKAGYRAHRRSVHCRADTLVHIEVRLEKGGAARR